MNFKRLWADFKYIVTNEIVINIPCWSLRKSILKCMGLKIGNNSRIGIGTKIVNPKGITIGDRTTINENCHLDGRGGLYIGNDVSMSIYTKILTASHRANSDTFEYYENSVVIEDNVWLGQNVTILQGVKIGEGAIIQAGSVVVSDIPSCSIAGGHPAKVFKMRNEQHYYELKSENKFF